MSRLLLIGLDGATFDLITPWVQEGKLPHLAKLMHHGVTGVLRSTLPPMSPPAWTSFVTGKNPGKHGIFDFTTRKPGSYEIEFINGRWRKAATVWKMMSEAGKRVCAMAVPISYPPEPINGVMISGVDTPGTGGIADASAFYPPALHAEVVKAVGPYIISANYAVLENHQCDAIVEAALQAMARKVATALYLYQKELWDCFMLVLGETDALSHRLWKYHDPTSPLATEDSRRYTGEDPLLRIYRQVDQHIGALCSLVADDTTIVIMSDHGNGGNGNKAVYLNRWLEEQQCLQFKATAQGSWLLGPFRKLVASNMQRAKTLGLKVLPLNLKRKLLRQTQLANKLESWLRFAHIDWLHTQAYSEETPYFPSLWINMRGREPAGIVHREDYDAVRERLMQALTTWADPVTGQRVVRGVYKREELYQGPFLEQMPDLIIDWNLDNGYSYLFKTSRGAPGTGAPIRSVVGAELETSKSGDHRDYGIFIASGKPLKQQAELHDAAIIDLAPTMLHLLDVPIPSDMDGKVLTSIFQEAYLSAHPVRVVRVAATHATASERENAYSAEEEEAIKARLQGLGYLE